MRTPTKTVLATDRTATASAMQNAVILKLSNGGTVVLSPDEAESLSEDLLRELLVARSYTKPRDRNVSIFGKARNRS